jgi:hypothetical protein
LDRYQSPFYTDTVYGQYLRENPGNAPNDNNNMDMGGLALAMAYVPWQNWEKPYELDVALARGTIFPSLDKPLTGCEVS